LFLTFNILMVLKTVHYNTFNIVLVFSRLFWWMCLV
jgi:hypothetical protein